MPPGSDINLVPKGKQGQVVTFTDILADGFVSGTFFDPADEFLSYTYGTKGKPKDQLIIGTASNEYVVTGDGNDSFIMKDGNDIVVSGGGDDTIRAGTGSNYIDGGDGIDSYVMETGYGDDVDLAAGTMTIGGVTTDVLLNIENVFGNNLDNVITGDDNANFIATGGGTDTVYGGGGDDQIEAYSQTGPKTFVGGTGDDVIFAGADADRFYWAAGDGADTVWYFDTADGTGDTLHLDLAGDQSTSTVAQLVADGFIRFVDDGNGHTMIQIDTNGGGDDFAVASSITFDDIDYSETIATAFEGNIVDDALLV